MRRRLGLLGRALLLAASLGGAADACGAPADAPPAAPAPPRLARDVVYGVAGGGDLLLDVARPAQGDGPFPTVLCLHGGGWQQGGKADLGGLLVELARRGYVAAAADYRLAPRWRFPGAVEDVSCAVRFLRARAADWNVDPDRIAAWGEGEGGHLALMLATLGDTDRYGGMGGHPDRSRRIQAAVAIGAPSDLGAWSAWPGAQPYLQQRYGKGSAGLLVDFLGTADRRAPVFSQASPRTHVSAGDAPVLSIHGENDPVVPVAQARALHAALAAASVPQRLVVVPGGGHAFAGAERDVAIGDACAFLAATLGHPTAAVPPGPTPAGADDDVAWSRDVVYARPAGLDLHLDLARPRGAKGAMPTLVCFHHGPYTPRARLDLVADVEAYARAGYVAATVEYRGPVKGAYPAPVEDGRAALRALRDRFAQGEWTVDPARMAVVGAKLGGWVALHLALDAAADGSTPRPRAAVVRYAPTDLADAAFADNPTVGRLPAALVGNARPTHDLLVRASPLTYAGKGDPPVLVFHGPTDRAIPFAQSERLVEALRAAGGIAELERLTGTGQGAERVPQTDADRADAKRVRDRTLEFLRTHL